MTTPAEATGLGPARRSTGRPTERRPPKHRARPSSARWPPRLGDGRPGIWISRTPPDTARRAAAEVERRLGAGERPALAGLTLAVKDNIDVAGLATTAACPAFAYSPAADATVVRALREAGAIVMGKANLDQFATGLVGTRSGYGLCPNAHWPDLVAGGSSSGSAVAVAAGLVDAALGTDTAGSGRVPAAANGVIGLKPTRGRLSTAGVVPACRSLDCVSVFARSLELAVRVAEVAARTTPDPADPWSRPLTLAAVPERRLRVGVPHARQLTFDDDDADDDRAAGATSRRSSTCSAGPAPRRFPSTWHPSSRPAGCCTAERSWPNGSRPWGASSSSIPTRCTRWSGRSSPPPASCPPGRSSGTRRRCATSPAPPPPPGNRSTR